MGRNIGAVHNFGLLGLNDVEGDESLSAALDLVLLLHLLLFLRVHVVFNHPLNLSDSLVPLSYQVIFFSH